MNLPFSCSVIQLNYTPNGDKRWNLALRLHPLQYVYRSLQTFFLLRLCFKHFPHNSLGSLLKALAEIIKVMCLQSSGIISSIFEDVMKSE